MRYSPYSVLFVQFSRVVCVAQAKICTWFVVCYFLGMEGRLTNIQEFLQLADNVGMFILLLEQKRYKH